ncbi:MAG: acyl-CoA dehydratase activase-related protein, partial [Pseudomonadota bacterium]
SFQSAINQAGREFLDSLNHDERAVIVLGKPYQTFDPFLNMNLGTVFRRLGVRALPGDLLPSVEEDDFGPVTWKHQGNMIRAARAVARDPRLFPVLVTCYGCGSDAFTLRHIREALQGKPMLVLEMDEHTSRAGMITRMEAFLDVVRKYDVNHVAKSIGSPETASLVRVPSGEESAKAGGGHAVKERGSVRTKPDRMYVPYMSDHAYAFAAAARSVGVEADVLPPPDMESERFGRPHVNSGECYPYVLILGDYLKFAGELEPLKAERSLFYVISPNQCRLVQFSRYIELVRRKLGLGMSVAESFDQGMKLFGLSRLSRTQILLRVWEGLNAYDVLLRTYVLLRPNVSEVKAFEETYLACRDMVFHELSRGRGKQGMEEALHELVKFSAQEVAPRPMIAVTGDYYTRVIPFANNGVYDEVEALGGTLLFPPTFSDCFKLGTLKDFVWNLRRGRPAATARHGAFYSLMALLEFRMKASNLARKAFEGRLDVMGLEMWKTASSQTPTRLPSGITAPVATALRDIDGGADGLLNLMTLNCSYGTVVTAVLLRALRNHPEVPMLTLVYDGLKKTNEKTRVEAFMEQVHDRFKRKPVVRPSSSIRNPGIRLFA